MLRYRSAKALKQVLSLMRNKMKKNKTILTLLLLVVLSSLCFAEKITLWEQKVNAQIEYQKLVADLSLKETPELEEIIIISRDLQITMYKMKREKYLYLISHHPKRIDPDNDLNFEWTDEDEKTLLELSKYYKSLKTKKKEFKTKNQSHPMWPALRESFVKIRETEEYKKIYKNLIEVLKREQ